MRRWWSLGFGCALLLLGCSSADGDSAASSFLDVDPEAVDTHRAPNDTDAPLNDSQSGSDTGRAVNASEPVETQKVTPEPPDPNVARAECAAFCQRYTSFGCEAPQCVAGCVQERCRAQLIRWGNCRLEVELCPESPVLVSACPQEGAAYIRCTVFDGPGALTVPMPDPRSTPDPSVPPGCTPDAGCECDDECDACLCAVDPSAADLCEPYCR